jgi:hypothetical protein
LINLGTDTSRYVSEHLKAVLEATEKHEGIVAGMETLPPSERALKMVEQKLRQANSAMSVTAQKIQESEKMKEVMENPKVQKAVDTTQAALESDSAKMVFAGLNKAKEGVDSTFESVRNSETGQRLEQKGKDALASLKESADHFLESFMGPATTAPAADTGAGAASADVADGAADAADGDADVAADTSEAADATDAVDAAGTASVSPPDAPADPAEAVDKFAKQVEAEVAEQVGEEE